MKIASKNQFIVHPKSKLEQKIEQEPELQRLSLNRRPSSIQSKAAYEHKLNLFKKQKLEELKEKIKRDRENRIAKRKGAKMTTE